MAFFKRELSPVERFESALKEKQAARQKLADRLGIAETVLGEKRAAAERLAVAGAANAQLDRAETNMRAVEERAKTLRAALAELDEQIASTERALADAKAQRDRDLEADEIEAMAAAARCSRLRTWFAGSCDPPRYARVRATRTLRTARHPSRSNQRLQRSSGN